MVFIDRYYMIGGGTLGLPLLSCYDDNGSYILFRMQDECVIRLTTATAATAEVSFAVGADTVSGMVSFAVSKVQYFVLNDLFRALFVKSFPTATALSGISGALRVEQFNSSGVSMGVTSASVFVCDSGGLMPSVAGEGLGRNFPDTFLFASGSAFGSFNYYTLRAVEGLVELIKTSKTGAVMETYTRTNDDGASIGGRAVWSSTDASCPAVISGGDSNGDQVGETPIFWDDSCGTETVPVLWWSSVDGGYKTRVAKIRTYSDRAAATAEFLQSFTARAAKDVSCGLALRFERLTLNDYAYYRDILSSGEVYVIGTVLTASGSSVEKIPVIVRGDYPTAGVSGVDIEFTVELANFSSL